MSTSLPSLSRLWEGVQIFARWWGSELTACLPAKWRSRLSGNSLQVDIRIGADGTKIDRLTASAGERYSDPSPIEHLDDGAWAELAQLCEGSRPRLILSPPDIYATHVMLPRAARGRLRQIIELQLEEVAPLRPEYLCWAIGEIAVVDDRLKVGVVMAKAARLEALRALVDERAGFVPSFAAETKDGAVHALATLYEPTGRGRWRSSLVAAAIVAATPLLIGIAACVLAAMNQSAIDRLREPAQTQLLAERKLRDDQQVRSAIAMVAKPRPASMVLDKLATQLPADTFATDIGRDRAGHMSMALETADPDQLRELLSRDSSYKWTETDQSLNDPDGRMITVYKGIAR